MDWVGWILAALALAYAIWVEHKNKQRRDLAHMALVNLKPAIQGANRADVIKAIDDTLEKLKK